jgi:uncharacterized protein (DUF1697 family)
MARLRELVGALGYEDVATHLQSGNLVYTTTASPAAAAKAISGAIADDLGLDVAVLVRTPKEMAAIVDGNPFADRIADPRFMQVAFLSGKPPAAKVKAVEPEAYAPDEFALGPREIYLLYPNGVQGAKLTHAFWEKRLGLTATGRNWNTVTRLRELAEGS